MARPVRDNGRPLRRRLIREHCYCLARSEAAGGDRVDGPGPDLAVPRRPNCQSPFAPPFVRERGLVDRSIPSRPAAERVAISNLLERF